MASSVGETVLFRAVGIYKLFGEFAANDDVSLTILPGEKHALLGENGAGKSTLVKMMYGVMQPTRGTFHWRGEQVVIPRPADARAMGIGMVFQHFSVFDALSVAENIALALPARADARSFRTHLVNLSGLWTCDRSQPIGSHAFGRRKAAGRDHPLPASVAPTVDHGRANFRAYPSGSRSSVRNPEPAKRRRLRDPLHQPTSWRR